MDLNLVADEEHLLEELLEILFMKNEDGERMSAKELLEFDHFGQSFTQALLKKAVDNRLVMIEDGAYELTSPGLERARGILRCHRLAERLLIDILNVQDEIVESSACNFEHILSEEIADSICTLLGHPRKCPHGKSIPPGECCQNPSIELLPILKPLSNLSPGDEGTVAYISSRFHERLSRLASLGVSPGQHVVVRQVKPSFIITSGETELALEKSIAEEIYLRIAGTNSRKERA